MFHSCLVGIPVFPVTSGRGYHRGVAVQAMFSKFADPRDVL